jgi:hypothetical protein
VDKSVENRQSSAVDFMDAVQDGDLAVNGGLHQRRKPACQEIVLVSI